MVVLQGFLFLSLSANVFSLHGKRKKAMARITTDLIAFHFYEPHFDQP